MRLAPCAALALIAGGLLWQPVPAVAAVIPIPGLFSTGVDDAGDVLANDQPETHYLLSSAPADSSLAVRTFTQPNFGTDTSWSGNSTTSDWIGADNPDPLHEPVGMYVYTTSFDLTPDLDPATAGFAAYVFADDHISDVIFNGIATHFQNFMPGTQQSPFQVPTRFDFTSGFVSGLNTLAWEVPNSGSPSGLRVQIISSVEQAGFGTGGDGTDLPEPASLALAASALAALVACRRSRSLPGRA